MKRTHLRRIFFLSNESKRSEIGDAIFVLLNWFLLRVLKASIRGPVGLDAPRNRF